MSDLHLNAGEAKVLEQMFMDGPVQDGDVACKPSRSSLVYLGLARHLAGFVHLTDFGLKVALFRGLDKKKERRSRLRAVRFFKGTDDSGHHYVVPCQFEGEWNAWVEQLNDDAPDSDPPEYAYRVEGDLSFKWPVADGVVIVEELNVA